MYKKKRLCHPFAMDVNECPCSSDSCEVNARSEAASHRFRSQRFWDGHQGVKIHSLRDFLLNTRTTKAGAPKLKGTSWFWELLRWISFASAFDTPLHLFVEESGSGEVGKVAVFRNRRMSKLYFRTEQSRSFFCISIYSNWL